MVRSWVKQPSHSLNVSCGTKADKKDELSRGRKADRFAGRSRSRSIYRTAFPPIKTKCLVSFPPLHDNAKEGEEPTISGWKGLFIEPKKVRKDWLLRFFKPMPHEPDDDSFVIVSEEAIKREEQKWNNCLVAYVVGKRPYFQALKDRLESQWNTKGPFQMHSLPGGYFLFRFSEEDDTDKVLWEGPWSCYRRPIVVKDWHIGMELQKDLFNSLPIWIRLPQLGLSFWDSESLGKIASVVRHPRFIDEATANRDWLSYARICVEITP